MSTIITWTKEAEISFNENIEYLIKSWDNFTINKFLDRVDAVIEIIRENPRAYPLHKKENIHKCVINKHLSLYYRIVDKHRIDLLTFWNSHQNLDRLKIM